MNTSASIPAMSLAVLMLSFVGCNPKPGKEDAPPKPKVLAMAGSAGALNAAPAPSPAPAADVVTGEVLKLGPAPAWQLQDLTGKTVDSEQFKGKVVVVDFWATWCAPCRAEIPGYVELQTKYGKDGFVIVGVSIDQAGPDVVKAFADKFHINYPLVMADEKIASAFGGVEVIPTTFLIDRTGQIRHRKEGSEETAEYEKKITAVLDEKS